MTADALPAGAPTPTDETANRLAELEQLLRDMFGVEDELAKAEARVAELETELAGLRSRQTRDEDGARIDFLQAWADDLSWDHSRGWDNPWPVIKWLIDEGTDTFKTSAETWRETIDLARIRHGDIPDPKAVAPSTPQNEGSSQ